MSTVSFRCQLPVLVLSQDAGGLIIQGGFISFPAATLAADPNGVIRPEPARDNVTTATPVLRGITETGGPFYDRAMNRWLPVGSGQTSPDGTSYAYAVSGATGSDPTQIHIVRVADGSDHVVSIAPPPQGAAVGWEVADFDGKSVYLIGQQVDQAPAGVWRLDLATDSVHQLVAREAGHVKWVQNAVAWIVLDNPADPSPPNPPKGEGFDTLARVDLSIGATTIWMYRPGQSIILWGLDSSWHPVVMVGSGPDYGPEPPLMLVTGPGASGIAIGGGILSPSSMEPDAGRLWFGTTGGIYYWTLATGLLKVYAVQPNGALQQNIVPAGHCV